MTILLETTVAEIAAAFPPTIRVFQRHGLDFCCGGKRPLAQACREHGLDAESVRGELERTVQAAPPPARDWTREPLAALIEHIVTYYHARLRAELDRLLPMADKVERVHGERHPEAAVVNTTLRALAADLEPHMMKEEVVLFPYVARLASGDGGGTPFATYGPIPVMEAEHEAAGRLLETLRHTTEGYTAPEDACLTFRGLYSGLAELEAELHEHIHLENNVLFPRVVELEAAAR
jgi:regulator of cell morphogenesis and NO signaling